MNGQLYYLNRAGALVMYDLLLLPGIKELTGFHKWL